LFEYNVYVKNNVKKKLSCKYCGRNRYAIKRTGEKTCQGGPMAINGEKTVPKGRFG
jgi:hypothetical protein